MKTSFDFFAQLVLHILLCTKYTCLIKYFHNFYWWLKDGHVDLDLSGDDDGDGGGGDDNDDGGILQCGVWLPLMRYQYDDDYQSCIWQPVAGKAHQTLWLFSLLGESMVWVYSKLRSWGSWMLILSCDDGNDNDIEGGSDVAWFTKIRIKCSHWLLLTFSNLC